MPNFTSLISKFNENVLKHPRRTSFFLFLWVVLLGGYGLGSLEFVRHTEADRTLIAMEMNESGSYLVPTLLGSQILTKPPLFYWVTAFFLKIFGSNSEGVARLSSLLSAALFVFCSYWFWFVATGKRRLSAIVAFALSCSVLFYILSAVAEIDMMFGFLASSALYAAFLVYEKFTRKRLAVFSFFVVLAFLTKGPPVYFFCLGAIGALFACDIFFKATSFNCGLKKIGNVLLGLIIALFLLSLWIIPLGFEVGWSSLQGRLDEEVFRRVLDYSERGRGPFFYVNSIFVNSLPWSLFLVVGVWHFARLKRSDTRVWHSVFGGYLVNDQVRRLFIYSLLVVVSGFVMLSVAQGKSARYSFPLIPFFVNIAVVLSPISLSKVYFKKLLFLLRTISFAGFFAFLGIYIFGDLQGVTGFGWFISGVFILAASLLGMLTSAIGIWRGVVPLIGFLFFAGKIVQTHMFVPHRNATRSVKPVAEMLVQEAKVIGAPIFTLEIFERWTIFYAKKSGLEVYRLTPEIVSKRMEDKEGETLLFLDLQVEGWRYYQAKMYSDKVKIKKIFPHITSSSFLISVPNSILDKLGVFSSFPTHPSVPFYPEIGNLRAENNL